MILVELKGGLGNQLFQYAAGISLAHHHKVPVKVLATQFNNPNNLDTNRDYELKYLVNPPLIATEADYVSMLPKNKLQATFAKFLPTYKRAIYKEKAFTFDANFFNTTKKVFLKGYRQSEKYFLPVENIIRKEFCFSHLQNEATLNILGSIQKTNAISIHIRRGDFGGKAENYHGILPAEFYQKAINYFESKLSDAVFFIFSNDTNWAADNLVFNHKPTIVSQLVRTNHFQDFYLMQHCKHQIIANSSFSWWAAWLNPNENKIVIAPKNWFNNKAINTKDLIPDSWIKM